jgi:two-component system chemotaxis sensor kinase CheA
MTLMIDIYGLLETAGFQSKESVRTTANRLLVAEDTPFFRTLIGNYFRSAGYEVTIANDGQQAWEILCERPDAFDVVISDIQMPKVDGYELVKLIKADPAKRHLPVIALSALSKPAEIEKGMAAGFDEYEVKIDRGQLVKTVERLIARGPNAPAATGAPVASSAPRRSRVLQPA